MYFTTRCNRSAAGFLRKGQIIGGDLHRDNAIFVFRDAINRVSKDRTNYQYPILNIQFPTLLRAKWGKIFG